jgi:hypothetical protein
MEAELNKGQDSSLQHQPEEHPSDGLAKELASGTISRRGALKLLGGASLGLLALPVFSSTASAAGKLLPKKTTEPPSLGTFNGVEYLQYEGFFVGKTRSEDTIQGVAIKGAQPITAFRQAINQLLGGQ